MSIRKNFKNLLGLKFGRLLVIELLPKRSKIGHAIWLCKCDCGNTCEVISSSLTTHNTESCGCFASEQFYNLRRPYGRSALTCLFCEYRSRMIKRGLEFSLSLKEFEDLTSKPCFYCGTLPHQMTCRSNSNGQYIYSTLDRLDCKKGYTLDNCVPACLLCNMMKWKLDFSEFKAQISKIFIHLG